MTAMKTRKPRTPKPPRPNYAYNEHTGEVYHATADAAWKTAFQAWSDNRKAIKNSDHRPCVPSPMPFNHIMFDGACTSTKPVAEPPTPVWTDGIGCLYAGQRVSWWSPSDRRVWFGGAIVSFDQEAGLLNVRRHDGGICGISPYDLA
jgi:hypothetical protein